MARQKYQKPRFTALYERLSRDDEQQGESNSIKNQKEFLEEYSLKNGFKHLKHFTDDGFSGVNFDRPGFNDMMEQIKAGNIQTIICKDLSRLGRNYLQVGYYTEIFFPENDVRFIAINNGVDSENGTENDLTPFINIMNEWYAKDTSKKIRAIFRARMENGLRCSGAIPYGYVHDPQNRQHLLIDKTSAATVKRIFSLAAEGISASAIARILTENKILIPSAYAEKNYPESCRNHSYHDPYLWSSSAVTNILEREEYLGHTVLRKTVCENYKSGHRRRTSPEERLIYKNTHEAIIDADIWELAQKCRRKIHRSAIYGSYSESQRLSGLLYCADCGHRLTYRSPNSAKRANGKVYDSDNAFVCGNYRSRVHSCTIHYIKVSTVELKLEKALGCIFRNIQKDNRLFSEKLEKLLTLSHETEIREDRIRLKKLKRRLSELDSLIKKLYEDISIHKISDRLYEKLLTDYDNEQTATEEAVSILEEKLQNSSAEKKKISSFVAIADKYKKHTNVTDAMLNELIEKIVVHESTGARYHKNQRIDIYFNHIGMIDIDLL